MSVAQQPGMNRLLALAIVAGCSQPIPEGPLAQTIRQAAEKTGVPRDLMVAIGHVEGGLLLSRIRLLRIDDDVPVAGILELRHGAFNSLLRGAELMAVDEDTLRIDTDLATEAGARVLRELGVTEDPATWREGL